MQLNYEPKLVQLHDLALSDARGEILDGLSMPDARVAPKYFYDALGSHLFGAITELDEYYPSRTEASILAAHKDEIARRTGGPGGTLIDLGAGDCQKSARLFDVLIPAQYAALDISVDYLRDALGELQRRHPGIEMIGVGIDFSSALALPDLVSRERRLFFYPGSSIGNFTPAQAVAFLGRLRSAVDPGGALLIGVDLVKDVGTLEAAYDDRLGVTACFNLNLLRHLNRIAGTDFRVEAWRHVARFDERESRIEMYLEARGPVEVHWVAGGRRFARGERIHTEYSYKYTTARFEAVAHEAGWRTEAVWTDPRSWFGVFLFRP